MGKVNCISFPGYDIRFFSEDHLAPHFHVIKTGEWHIRVYFLQSTEENLAWDYKYPAKRKRPTGRFLKELRNEVHEHRDLLYREFLEKVCQE